MAETPSKLVNPTVPNANAVAGNPVVDTTVVDKAAEMIHLPRGKELSESAATALAVSRPVQWVVVAGPVGSGKTTLLSCLYELFQKALVADYLFAGSDTLPAFEERCHLSRMLSDSLEPDTARTLYAPSPTYLHLKVASDASPRSTTEFLFTDVSGEMFEHARDSTKDCKELTFLRRAGNVLFLLDSKKVLNLDERWAVVEEAKSLLQSCLDSKMVSPDCVVNVVWSKFDYIVAAGKETEHQGFQNEVAVQFRGACGNRIKHLLFSKVAARPMRSPGLGFGMGVVELFKGWITFRPRERELCLLPEQTGTRESELFGRRHFNK